MMFKDDLYGFGEMVWRNRQSDEWKAPLPGQEGYTEEERLRYIASLFFITSDLLTAIDPDDARLEFLRQKVSSTREEVAREFRDIGLSKKIMTRWFEKTYFYEPKREDLLRVLHRLQQGDTESELG